MNNVICIPARMESTRFYGKPLAEARGRPLLAWTIDAARASKLTDAVWVVTDSGEIAEWCRNYENHGVKCHFAPTPASNGTDRIAQFLLSQRLDETPGFSGIEKVVNLQCDEPEVTGEFLDDVFLEIDDSNLADIEIQAVTAVFPLPRRGKDDPNLVKAVVHAGRAYWFSRHLLPGAFGHLGVYGFTWQSLLRFHCDARRHLESLESLEQMRIIEMEGEISTIQLPKPVRSINTPEDLARWNADVGTAVTGAVPA